MLDADFYFFSLGTKPFSCSHCEKSFSRREKLRDHERIHSGERPYVCDICQKGFADSGNFSNHKKFHRNPELKHPSRKKSSATRNRSLTGNIHQMNPLFPVINVDENRSLLSINVDSVPQLPAQERVTEFNSGQQQQIMFVTFPSSAVIAEKPNDGEKTCEGTRTEPLILQLHSLTDSHDQIGLAGNSSNNNENTELSNERFGSSEDPDKVNRAVRHEDEVVSTSGFQPTSPGNFVDSSIQMTGSLQQILSAVSESQQILEQSNPAAGFIMPGYSSDLQEPIDSEEKNQGNVQCLMFVSIMPFCIIKISSFIISIIMIIFIIVIIMVIKTIMIMNVTIMISMIIVNDHYHRFYHHDDGCHDIVITITIIISSSSS